MALDSPVFVLDSEPPNQYISDAMWWFWLRLAELEPTTQLGGIYANKPHFHNTGQANLDNWPDSYSIRDTPNKTGPYWKAYAAAIDWTFPEAQSGDYGRISKYSKRLYDSGRDPNDPRLDQVMYQFFGQTDWDSSVEGWNEYKEQNASSDSSHLWHMHIEIFRCMVHDYWAYWALLTVLMGWTVEQWRASGGGSGGGDSEMYALHGMGLNGSPISHDTMYLQEQMLFLVNSNPGYAERLPEHPLQVDGKYGSNTDYWVSVLLTGGAGTEVNGAWFSKLDQIVIDRKIVLAGVGQGPAGPAGPEGPKGDKGDKGDAAVLAAGTILTVTGG